MASNMNTMEDDKLKIAAQNGDINLLYTIIQEDPYVLERIDSIPFVETPLHVAASAGHLQFATEIMRLKPSFAWKLNQQGFSPIHLAMNQGKEKMVLRFVNIDKDLVRVKGREGLTPLHLASQIGQIDLLAHFFSACPESIEDVTVRSETALHIAMQNQQYEALQVLVGWLRRAYHKGSEKLQERILNWKDEAGNTVLHISALMNDSEAVRLLVNTKVYLNARNIEKSTALDVARSAEIKALLSCAGVKCGSSINDNPTFADELRSKITTLDTILILMLKIRTRITEEQRNACLVIAVLVATVIFQSTVSPPGGFYQVDAGVNNVNTTSLNSTANASQRYAGKSVMPGTDFFYWSCFNTVTLWLTMMIIKILTPSTTMGTLLISPLYFLGFCYFLSLMILSPTSLSAFFIFLAYLIHIIGFLWIYRLLWKIYHKEIRSKNRARRNIW